MYGNRMNRDLTQNDYYAKDKQVFSPNPNYVWFFPPQSSVMCWSMLARDNWGAKSSRRNRNEGHAQALVCLQSLFRVHKTYYSSYHLREEKQLTKIMWLSVILVSFKVHIFWEGHKNLDLLSIYTLTILINVQKKRGRWAKFLWPTQNILTL